MSVDTTHQQYDVVVVGSGAGAMTGAYLAAKAGLRTIVVERTSLLGGTSAYSGAACWLPGSQVQQRADVGDSTESARTYLRSLLGEDHLEHQEAFLAKAPEVVAALESDPAIDFQWQAFPDYFDRPGRVPGGRSINPVDLDPAELGDRAALIRPSVELDRVGRGHRDGPLQAGRALIGRLLIAMEATGNGTVLRETCVDELVVEDGRVVAVIGTGPTGKVRIDAARGVLVGAGGFERNPETRAQAGVPGSAAWSMAPAGTNRGEVLAAAVAIGAATSLMDEGWWCPAIAMPDGGASFTLGFRGGIIVDRLGKRFANECLPYDQMGRTLAADPGNRVPSHIIFDNREGGRLPAIAMPGGKPADHLAAGTWVEADTLEELAAQIDVPAEALMQTVARFNTLAGQGHDDDFGRGEDEYALFFANPALVPLEQPPFRAARLVLGDLGTKGGLVTDPDGRVLHEDGSPIEGLYAFGNSSASMTGHFYPGPGIPIGTAMTFAARAVDHVAGHRQGH